MRIQVVDETPVKKEKGGANLTNKMLWGGTESGELSAQLQVQFQAREHKHGQL